jgi:hypothetical protein
MHFSIFQKTIFNLNHLVSKNVRLKRPREPSYASSVQRIPRLDVLDRNARKLESGKRWFNETFYLFPKVRFWNTHHMRLNR